MTTWDCTSDPYAPHSSVEQDSGRVGRCSPSSGLSRPDKGPPICHSSEDLSLERQAWQLSGDAPRIGGVIRRAVNRLIVGFMRLVRAAFEVASLVVLLAVLTAIPALQLIAFGYLLEVAGRLTSGSQLRDAVSNRREAGAIGLAVIALWTFSLPLQLLWHWESVAALIDPQSTQASLLRVAASGGAVVALLGLLWAWVRGGRWWHYLWPQPKRFFREAWRWRTWRDAPDRLWDFTASLRLPARFWLGLRGAVGTLVWLLPATVVIAANREGQTGLAGLIGGLAVLSLGVVLLYLPMLQAHFAAENRLRALFAVQTIRGDFRRAPWAWLAAMTVALVLLPIPLYLLKIEATPREVLWLPCLVFVALMLPARVATGLALRRARRRPEPSGLLAACSRWSVRLLMLVVVGIYLSFLTVSQYTSWDGLQTWVRQHAVLVPVPFVGL